MFGRSILIVLFATISIFGQKGQVVEKEVKGMGLVGLNVGLKQKAANWRLAKQLI
jgi:hypothetical protein